MKPSAVTLGDIDDYVEFDDKQEVSWYWKLLCCICMAFEPKSHTLRLRKKVLTFDGTAAEKAKDAKILQEKLSEEQMKNTAATKIQKIARGRIGKKLFQQAFTDAIATVDNYWRNIYQERLDEKERERLRREARKKVLLMNFQYN